MVVVWFLFQARRSLQIQVDNQGFDVLIFARPSDREAYRSRILGPSRVMYAVVGEPKKTLGMRKIALRGAV